MIIIKKDYRLQKRLQKISTVYTSEMTGKWP